MVEVIDQVGSYLPSFESIRNFGLGSMSVFTWILVGVLFAVIGFIFFYLWLMKKKYNKKIILFEKIGVQFIPIKKYWGCEIKFSTAGDTITKIRGIDKFLPNPTKQMGLREYWYFIREDGEWINFELADLDEESRKVGAKFLDKEMRFSRTAIQKSLRDQFEKKSFMEKYGVYVVTFSFLAIIIVGMWFLWDKWLDLANVTKNAVETADMVLQKTNSILSTMDNVCSGGSGIVR